MTGPGAMNGPQRADGPAREDSAGDAVEGGPRLVLASASPRRRDVLRQLDLQPDVRSADVDEAYLPGETPEGHVERLARLKAETVLGSLVGTEEVAEESDPRGVRPLLVVGGDTVVVLDGRVLAKPTGASDAVSMLLALSGRTHHVLSGLAVAARGTSAAEGSETGDPGGDAVRLVSGVVRTAVRMRSFDEETARRYVTTSEPMDKAGSYGIQGRGAALVAGIEGDYYSVVGFPVGLFLDLLGEVGWRFAFGSLTPDPDRP